MVMSGMMIRCDSGDDGSILRGVVEGLPPGVNLPAGYIGNQLVRIMNQIGVARELGMFLDGLTLGKRFDPGIAMGAQQNADRHVQFFV